VTDGQNYDSKDRASIASRGKNGYWLTQVDLYIGCKMVVVL